MLPLCYPAESVNSISFEFPPGHCIRICEEGKQLYKTKQLSVSKHAKASNITRKSEHMD